MRGKRRENTVEEPRNFERGALPTTQAAKRDSGDPGNRAAKRSRPETPAASASQRRRRRSLQASAAE